MLDEMDMHPEKNVYQKEYIYISNKNINRTKTKKKATSAVEARATKED